jgi:hypothetical protein
MSQLQNTNLNTVATHIVTAIGVPPPMVSINIDYSLLSLSKDQIAAQYKEQAEKLLELEPGAELPKAILDLIAERDGLLLKIKNLEETLKSATMLDVIKELKDRIARLEGRTPYISSEPYVAPQWIPYNTPNTGTAGNTINTNGGTYRDYTVYGITNGTIGN